MNVMVNGTLSISIRLQNDDLDHDHVSVSSSVSPTAAAMSSTHIPPPISSRAPSHVPHSTFSASSWSRQPSTTAEEDSSYMGGRSNARALTSSNYG